jgi:uroporphyrinogen decarboxylase
MRSNKPFLAALAGETLTPPPVWLMRQAGRYLPEYREVRAKQPDFINFCLNPEAAAEVTLQPIRRYGFDAAIVFADILLIPYGLGQKTWFEKGEGPKLTPLTQAMQDSLDIGRAREVLKPVSETLSRVKAELPDETALIGFCGSPWTVATYMIEGGGSKDRFETRALAWSDPERFDALMDTLVESSALYLADQAAAGADALKLFDSWADGLPDPLFDRVVIEPTRKIVARLRELGVTAPVIGFPRGAGPQAVRYAQKTGVTALALDHGVDTGWAMEAFPKDLPLQGQLDPAVLRAGGAVLDAEVDRLLSTWGGRPYVFNLGHGIHLNTPPENVAQLLRRVRGA